MTELKAHKIYAIDNETGKPLDFAIASIKPVSHMGHVRDVVESNYLDSDGRSNWCWVRLQSGDLILGVFPQGTTYFDVQEDANRGEE